MTEEIKEPKTARDVSATLTGIEKLLFDKEIERIKLRFRDLMETPLAFINNEVMPGVYIGGDSTKGKMVCEWLYSMLRITNNNCYSTITSGYAFDNDEIPAFVAKAIKERLIRQFVEQVGVVSNQVNELQDIVAQADRNGG